MSIYRLNIDNGALQQSGQVRGAPSAPLRDPPQETGTAETGSDQVLLSGSLGAAYKELQLKNEQQNVIADGIRKTDRAAEALGQKIDALKAPLQAIVKNFPPFSAEDRERIKLLKEYSSLRKEIDRVTVPPPPDVIQARRAVTLPPSLAGTADDSQITDHISKLDAAAAEIGGFRQELAADTASLLPIYSSSSPLSAAKGSQSAPSGASLTESAALQLSVKIGRQFAISVRQGVTVDEHPQFLRGLS